MAIELLKAPEGSRKNKNRVGRGPGSGNGKTSGRGHKGQNSRKGGGVRIGFEGGQTPLYRRLPKRGFGNSRFTIEYNEVNLSLLNIFKDGQVVGLEDMKAAGILYSSKLPVKILANGELTKKIEVVAHKFSKAAAEKIEKVGGKAVIAK
ncbi:MAG TPA: 50S ribosomal protein L15 [Spirochaetota bacterium]|nr:50S ribosomal protein L15 [Spirochaetota bacterium]